MSVLMPLHMGTPRVSPHAKLPSYSLCQSSCHFTQLVVMLVLGRIHLVIPRDNLRST